MGNSICNIYSVGINYIWQSNIYSGDTLPNKDNDDLLFGHLSLSKRVGQIAAAKIEINNYISEPTLYISAGERNGLLVRLIF